MEVRAQAEVQSSDSLPAFTYRFLLTFLLAGTHVGTHATRSTYTVGAAGAPPAAIGIGGDTAPPSNAPTALLPSPVMPPPPAPENTSIEEAGQVAHDAAGPTDAAGAALSVSPQLASAPEACVNPGAAEETGKQQVSQGAEHGGCHLSG